jgi:hypothetical protein
VAFARMLGMLDQNQIARDTVALVFGQSFGGLSQYGGVGAGASVMDRRAALEPGAGGVARVSYRAPVDVRRFVVGSTVTLRLGAPAVPVGCI